jgi:short-subunit dehydrogenase
MNLTVTDGIKTIEVPEQYIDMATGVIHRKELNHHLASIGFDMTVLHTFNASRDNTSLRQITVNSVAPGFIATEMTEQLSEDIRKKMSDQVALNRLGDPQDIANAVSFLASDKANYITGTVMHVNGGLYMS